MLASRARGWMSATASKPVVPGLPLDVRVGSLCKFDDPGLPGVMHATASLRAVSCGTELSIEQDGTLEATPLEACYLGWQDSLTLLARLVEAEIREWQGPPPALLPGCTRRPLGGSRIGRER